MWTIKNETPFCAEGAVMQHWQTGRKQWTVAVKATFAIHDDGCLSVCETQQEILREPVFHGIEYESSLKYDIDLTQIKEKVDVILNAAGYHPENSEATELTVGIAIGRWGKQLVIKGQRYWDRFFGIPFAAHPHPFKTMAIRYENAFGGRDDLAKQYFETELRNPVGVGYAFRKHRLKGKPLPTIETPEASTKANFRKNRIAGFGAIPSYWKPRIDYAGTYDQDWEENRFPLLPPDVSPRCFQSAPEDQQLDGLIGGETVTLVNLTANRSRWSFDLPRISFGFITVIEDSVLEHKGTLQTVIVEPDEPRLIMVWQTAVDCDSADVSVEKTTVFCRFDDINPLEKESS